MDARRWGSTAAERSLPLPCDDLLPDADVLHRAVTVDAPAAVMFRWLCQLRVAPYSYDLIDNFGHRSPQELTPGLEALAPGQRMMRVFELASFEPGRSITLVPAGTRRPFGELAVTYAVLPAAHAGPGEGGAAGPSSAACRLLIRVRWAYPGRGPLARLTAAALPPLDLVMARRQLLNLKRLAERERAA